MKSVCTAPKPGRWSPRRADSLRANRLKRLRLPGLALACLLLVAVTAFVVAWLQPVRPPRLLIISSDSTDSPLLPPSPYVENDAKALADLNSIFDTSETDANSLGLGEMQTLVSQLDNSAPQSRWFSWQKTTTLLYVNASGVAVRDSQTQMPTAYLLPDDFGAALGTAGFPQDKAVPVTSVLKRLMETGADQKILVLDCQRLDHHWPMGILANEFVSTVQAELQKNAAQYRGLIVMFSCAPGEVSWSGNSFRHSAFAYYFLRGITGAADSRGGDNDLRITVAELSAYIHSNVKQWTTSNRADTQQPLLHAVGINPDEVVLAAIDPRQTVYTGSIETTPSSEQPETAARLAALAEAWQQYYDLPRTEPGVVSFAPHLLRRLEDTLLRAESHFRCDKLEAMDKELRKVSFRLEAIEAAHQGQALKSDAYSLPLSKLFQQWDSGDLPTKETVAEVSQTSDSPVTTDVTPTKNDTQPPKKEADAQTPLLAPGAPPQGTAKETPVPSPTPTSTPKDEQVASVATPVTAAEIERLITEALRGTGSLEPTANQLQGDRFSKVVIPVEAEFLRMLARNKTGQLDAATQQDHTARERHLLRNRVLAEQAAVPATVDAPRVFPWIRDWVDLADQFRRRREDEYFALSGRQVRLGNMTAVYDDEDGDLYRESLRAGGSLAEAFRIRDRVTAELPHLTNLSAMRDWQSDNHNFRKQICELTFQLLTDTNNLSHKLYAVPADDDLRARRQMIAEITTVAKRLQTTRTRMLSIVGKELRKLCRQKDTSSAGSNIVWRRTDAMLKLPFAYSTEPSATLAKRRIQLLGRVRQAVERVGDIRVNPNDQIAAVARNIQTQDSDQLNEARKLTLGFFSLADAIDEQKLRDERESSGYSPAVAEAWLTAYQAATSPLSHQNQTDRLVQADTACRIIESYPVAVAFRSYQNLPTQVLRRRNLAALCAWHGLRLAEDFWAGAPNADDYYFHKAGTHYLELAQQLFSLQGIGYTKLTSRLRELQLAATGFRQQQSGGIIFADPPRLVYRGKDSVLQRYAIETPESCPRGIGRLRCLPADSQLAVRQLPDESGDYPLPFNVTRPPGAAISTMVMGEFFFRGHLCQRPFHVHAAGDEAGPTVSIEDLRPDDAQLLIRLAEVNAAPANVLFVLDCSRSMLEGGRMQMLRKTLDRFARTIGNSSLSVGVRVFGDRVVWHKYDPQSEQAAKKDSRNILKIQPFHQGRFAALLPGLRAVGETPLFHALLQTPQDFAEVGHGAKVVILVSDGADNWAAVGEKPGVAELGAALAKTAIQINAIGFQTDDAGFRQLQEIAATTGGTCVRAERADELLDSMVSLARLLKYTVTTRPENDDPVVVSSGALDYAAEPLSLTPGLYDISIIGRNEELITTRKAVRIRRGERHELLFGGGDLIYPAADMSTDLAVTQDENLGVTLRVLRAEQQQSDLVLDLALVGRSPAWYPQQVQFRVKPRGGENSYSLQDIPANVPGYHFPVWRICLRNWPRKRSYADLEVAWSEAADAEQSTYHVGWDDPVPPELLPAGFSIARREFKPRLIAGEMRSTATIALVFPENYRRIQDWSLELNHPSEYSRRTDNLLDGVHTSHFVLPNEARPRTLIIRGPHAPRKRLKTAVNLRARKIN